MNQKQIDAWYKLRKRYDKKRLALQVWLQKEAEKIEVTSKQIETDL